jgi:polyhydroxyalkanoate synthesis regulator phasin
MKKPLIWVATSIVALGLCGIAIVSAQAENSSGNYPTIIQKLVEKFNLNAEEVQQVFDEVRQERQQEMQNNFKGLTEEKMQGLTDEQKQALSAKREELKGEMEALKDLSQEERQAKMEEIRNEMKTWAEENGIDSNLLRMPGTPGGRFNGGFDRGFGPPQAPEE